MEGVKHIAFIMDGNGRWAKKRLLPRKLGHREGVKALKKVIFACRERGIEVVSFYAFSTENWSRPKEEVDALFAMILEFAGGELEEYAKDGYRITIMGSKAKMPENVATALEKIEEKTRQNRGMVINLGINYGGRDEIVEAVNILLKSGKKEINSNDISSAIYTKGLPDPDIIVRTSGEQRLSNFMLWQCAYSEFVFLDDLWPDVDAKTIDKVLNVYKSRDRKFGGVKA